MKAIDNSNQDNGFYVSIFTTGQPFTSTIYSIKKLLYIEINTVKSVDKLELLERILNEPKKLSDRGEKQKIKLDSYVISVTSAREIQPIFHTSQPSTLMEHHILVQEENGKYIREMLGGG